MHQLNFVQYTIIILIKLIFFKNQKFSENSNIYLSFDLISLSAKINGNTSLYFIACMGRIPVNKCGDDLNVLSIHQ